MQLLYLSPLPWSSFAQRPHKLAEWFHAETGGRVLWVDPYPTRLPRLSDFNRLRATPSPAVTDIPVWLDVVRPVALPIEPLPLSGWFNRLVWRDTLRTIKHFIAQGDTMLGLGKPSVLGLQVLSLGPFHRTFYDAMDDFAAFYRGYSKHVMRERELETITRTDMVFASSSTLRATWQTVRPDVRLIHNACAPETLPDVVGCSKNLRPVLGYVGTIATWFDWELVIMLAHSCPDVCIRLIGPVFVAPPGDLPPNIEMLPPCNHADAMRHAQAFDIGLIPFRLNQLTDSVDPIKYYEYRALGLPVLTTSFGEMRFRSREPGVYMLERGTDLSAVVTSALSIYSAAGRDDALQFRERNSWSARFRATGLLST